MGSFHTNITMRDISVPAVVSWLADRDRPAAVGYLGRFVVLSDKLGEAQDGSHAKLAAELSIAFRTSAIAAMNHDDDVLGLHLFDRGSLIGEYDSDPSYFGPYFAPEEEYSAEEVEYYERLEAERAASRGPELDPEGTISRFGEDVDALSRALQAGIDGAPVPADLSSDGYFFANDRHAAVADALGLNPSNILLGCRCIMQGDRPEAGEIHFIE